MREITPNTCATLPNGYRILSRQKTFGVNCRVSRAHISRIAILSACFVGADRLVWRQRVSTSQDELINQAIFVERDHTIMIDHCMIC